MSHVLKKQTIEKQFCICLSTDYSPVDIYNSHHTCATLDYCAKMHKMSPLPCFSSLSVFAPSEIHAQESSEKTDSPKGERHFLQEIISARLNSESLSFEVFMCCQVLFHSIIYVPAKVGPTFSSCDFFSCFLLSTAISTHVWYAMAA